MTSSLIYLTLPQDLLFCFCPQASLKYGPSDLYSPLPKLYLSDTYHFVSHC